MIAVYIDDKLDKHFDKVKTTFDFVFKTLGYEYRFIKSISNLKKQEILLFYSDFKVDEREVESVVFDGIFIQVNLEEIFWELAGYGFKYMRSCVRKKNFFSDTPILSTKELSKTVEKFERKHCKILKVNFDFFSTIFFYLSGYYDFLTYHDKEDKHLAFKPIVEEYKKHPHINYLLKLFDSILQTLYLETDGFYTIRKDFWPGGENYAVMLTHTVDKLYKWPFLKIFKSFFEDLLVFYKFKYVFKNFKSKMKAMFTNKEEYWNFDEIMDIEKRYNVTSTYFWGMEKKDNIFFDYKIDDNDIVEMIYELEREGFDNLLLLSESSYKNDIYKEQIEKLKRILKKPVLGVRIQNYKFDITFTPRLFMKNNIFFDSTFGIPNDNGFRNGLGFPYEFIFLDVYHNAKGIKMKKTGTLEIPVNFKDRNLIISKYKNVSFEDAAKQIDDLIKNIKIANGLLTFDFTVSNFADITYLKRLYKYLLKKILNDKPYVAKASDVSVWWRKRNAVHILQENRNNFIIFFPEKFKQFSFHIFAKEINDVIIKGAEFQQDIKDKNKFILKNIESNSKVYVSVQ